MTIQPLASTPVNNYGQQIQQTENLSNKEIIKESCNYGNQTAENSFSSKLLKALPALAVGSVALANGLLTKGKCSTKIKNVLYSLGAFAAVNAIYDGVKIGFNKLDEKSGAIQQIDERSPMVGALARVGICFGTSALALKGVKEIGKAFVKRFPKVAQDYEKASKNLANIIDKSKLAEVSDFVTNGLKSVAKKFPTLSKIAKKYSFLIMIASYIGLTTGLMAITDANKQKAAYKKAEELSNQRQMAQDAVKKAEELKPV